MVELELSGRKITAPVWIQAGHPDNSVTVYLGYGRTRAGRAGTGAGFDVYPCARRQRLGSPAAEAHARPGDTYKLASTQGYQTMDTPNGDTRPLVREASLEEYRKEPKFAQEERAAARNSRSIPATTMPSRTTPGAWRST